MKNFDWDRFNSGDTAVNCKTRRDAIDFLHKCSNRGMQWYSGKSLEIDNWDEYQSETCYMVDDSNKISFGRKKYSLGYKKIVEWDSSELAVELQVYNIIKEEKYYIETNMGKFDVTDMVKNLIKENNHAAI